MCLKFSCKLLEIVVRYLEFREYLCPCQLIDFMRKVVCGSVGLYSKLKFRYYFFIDGDFESYIADGLRVGKPALDLSNPVSLFRVLLDKLLDLVDSQDDVLDLEEYTLSPNHIANFECNFVFLFQ